MGHYDAQREAHDDELHAQKLKAGRKTIVARLRKLSGAMHALGLSGWSDLDEAVEHFEAQGRQR